MFKEKEIIQLLKEGNELADKCFKQLNSLQEDIKRIKQLLDIKDDTKQDTVILNDVKTEDKKESKYHSAV